MRRWLRSRAGPLVFSAAGCEGVELASTAASSGTSGTSTRRAVIDDGSLLRCRRKQHAQRGNSGAAVISSPPTEIAAPASPSTAELPFARQFLHWKDASIASAILQQLAEAASGVSSHSRPWHSHPQLVDTWSLRSFPATSIFGAIRPKSSLETAKPRQSLQVLARPTGSPPEQMLQATPTSCAASRHSHARRRRAAMCTVVRAHTWHELTHTRQ